MSLDFLNRFQIAPRLNITLRCYLEDIFEDIAKVSNKNNEKSINMIAFHDFMNLPMLVSEKIYLSLLKEGSHKLDKEIFVQGITMLFCANSTDGFTRLLFKILDFNSIGQIYTENIKVFFRQFHIMMCNNNNTLGLNEIIINSNGKDCLSINYERFVNRLENNADVLYLFIVFIYQRFYKEKDSIDYYSNVICRDIVHQLNGKTIVEDDIYYNYGPPSELLLKYIKRELKINYSVKEVIDSFLIDINHLNKAKSEESLTFDQDDHNELSELDSFENEVNSCMLKNIIDTTISQSIPQLLLKKRQEQKSMKLIHFSKINKTNQLKKSNSLKSILSNCPNKKQYKSIINEFNCITPCFNGEGLVYWKNKKLILIGNSLFYFTYTEKSQCYTYSGILYLQKNYIIPKQIDDSQIDFKPSVIISSDYGGNYKSKSFSFNDYNQYHSFCEQVSKAINYRNILDNITIDKEIDSGSCGKIYRGYSHLLNKKVCIKVIGKKGKKKTVVKLIRWEKEIVKYLSKISHSYVMEAYDAYEDELNVYLILEYIEGTPLSYHRLQSQNDKNIIMSQVVQAVQFLHEQSIVHRDIKSHNIMLCLSRKTIKVVDFGFSRILTKYDSATEYCGSLNFSAPEILLNKPYNITVDIWSLGVLLYWLQYNIMPFQSVTNDEERTSLNILNTQIAHKQVGFIKDQLLLLCFKHNPQERSSCEHLRTLFVC